MSPVRPTDQESQVPASTYAYLQHLLQSRTGTVSSAAKEYLIEARLFALAQEEGFGSVNGLLEACRPSRRRARCTAGSSRRC